MERARPVDVLIEEVALRLAAAGDEHAIQGLAAAEAGHFRTALTVTVHVVPHERIELRQRLAIHTEAKTLAGKTHVVGAIDADPPPCGQLRQHEGGGAHEEEHQKQRAHARLQTRRRRGVRST